MRAFMAVIPDRSILPHAVAPLRPPRGSWTWPLTLVLAFASFAGNTACAPHAAHATARAPSDEGAPFAPHSAVEGHSDGSPGSAPADAEVASIPVAGSSITGVRATVVVEATAERVRAVVFDFARYPDFMPSVRSGRLLGRTAGGGRSVYLEFEEMGGVIQLWVRAEISPPATSGGVESHDGRLVAGNIKDYRIRWCFEAIASKRTRLTVDSFVDPGLFLPSSLINRVSREAAKNAILALKHQAEFASLP